MFRKICRYGVIFVALNALVLSLSSCGAPGPVKLVMTEYAFQLSQSTVKSGNVTFQIVNSGSIVHEAVVEQTDLTFDKLPMGADGAVDEEKLTSMGEQGDIEAGNTVDLTLNLHPGRYMIICNLPGHFQKGMYTELTVTQ